MNGFFWGGVAKGLQQGAERQRQREMLDLQKKRFDLEDKESKFKMQELERQLKARLTGADILERGTPDQFPQAAEQAQPTGDEFQDAFQGGGLRQSMLPQPASQERQIAAAFMRAGMNPPASLFAQQKSADDLGAQLQQLRQFGLLPEGGIQQGAAGGGLPPGVAVRAGPISITGQKPEPPTMSAEQLQSLYGLPPQTAAQIATLPPAAQERTIDNLRQMQGQEASQRRFQESQSAMESRFQQSQSRLAQQTGEREAREVQREQLRREQLAVPPLSAKEREDLRETEQGLADVKRLKELFAESKGRWTGRLQGGPLRSLKELTDTASKEQLEFNSKLAKLVNRIRNRDFGAALTQYEGAEALKDLPDTSQGDKTVGVKLDNMEAVFNKVITDLQKRKQHWERFGGGGGPPAGWERVK